MATQFVPLLNTSQAAGALHAFGLRSHAPSAHPAGSWKLVNGHAVTLHDLNAAVLRITCGSVWATVDGPHAGPANNQGDLFLKAGERLTLQPGQRVVIEPWRASANEAVYFSWDPAPAAPRVALQREAQAGSRTQVAVLYPLRDLGLALRMAAQALGGLVWGIAGLSEFLVAGRVAVCNPAWNQTRLDSARPK